MEYHGDPWDKNRGAMMFTNLGAPVHSISVEVNGRPECTMKLYAVTPGAEQRVGFWLTEAEHQRFNDAFPIDLTLLQGDQFVTFIPSVLPIPAVGGEVSCGMQLVHLELTTDDGVLTWDMANARRQGGGGTPDDGIGEGD